MSRRMGARRLHRSALVAAGAAGLATLLVSLEPALRFAYLSAPLHLVLETASGLVALLAAYLLFSRFRATGRLADLTLVTALGLFAASNLFLAAMPAALWPETYSHRFATWAPLIGRLLGAGLFAVSPFLRSVRVRRTSRAAMLAATLSVVAIAATAGLVHAFSSHLSLGIDPSQSPRSAPSLSGSTALLALQLLACGLFVAAAIGFARIADDGLMRWFEAGSIFAAFAYVNYMLFPSLYSSWVYTGDILRLAFYVTLLTGAAREIGGYWRAVSAAAILDERRRIARDLHDGLAQELAFIGSETGRLAGRNDDPNLEHIGRAAERALDESRRAIAALTQPLDQPFADVLADVAEDVGLRFGLRLELDLEPEVEAPPETREALLRVVREAVTNAARHGRATTVRIELADTRGLHLRITDDGGGFDPSAAAGGATRFGLTSMRERVEALGGHLEVASRPGAGTSIEVAVP